MDRIRNLGILPDGTNVSDSAADRERLVRYLNVKLAALGVATVGETEDTTFLDVAHDLLARHREYARLLGDHLCPADARIQAFLDEHLSSVTLKQRPRLPRRTLIVDRHGLSRQLSLPNGANHFKNDMLDSYRVRQGVLHNPKSDRRTTEGVFHIAEGGLPIPADKLSVPLQVYGNLLYAALNPPTDMLRLPFTANADHPAELFVSLLLRPTVQPEVPGFSPRKSMEVRFFAPGALVSNLDFVESIFGNAGDPHLPENDAALDVMHWTGHTGCVILAPHITQCKKRELGLPNVKDATDRQREQKLCWSDPDELYNDGKPFKITCRTTAGVMVTILADNYYGYSKKEIKTQISYAANLFGVAEEEHAGGALAFPCYLQGDQFLADSKLEDSGQRFSDTVAALGDKITVHAEGYATDNTFPDILYMPRNVAIDLPAQRVSWVNDGHEHHLKLLAHHTYVLPSGYKVRMEKHPGAPSWRLVGTAGEPTFVHKPCTVSGGGKSEISKSILGSIVYGPIYIGDFAKDFDFVERIIQRDYSDRFLPNPDHTPRPSRPILSPERSLGSVIKLLTPSPDFTPAFNDWLESIPEYVRPLVYIVKRFYQPNWGDNWREHFSVDAINGSPGHQLKLDNRPLVGSYLRVGLSKETGWRLYKLRQDFIAADKVQMEDDISASVVVPAEQMPNLPEGYGIYPSVKIVENCETRLFQRPDDAIHRGLDAQAEHDMAQRGLFASNYQPITAGDAREMVQDVVNFEKFTSPMRELIRGAVSDGDEFVVSSANPRIVDGKPTKNPRYLQTRPDVARPRDRYLAEVSTRLFRRLPPDAPVVFPVSSIMSGRRNNPADIAAGIRPLAVFNPIHYQELPELFMDYVCSLTGKSPSTTGAGSEGALTKGPFNALVPAPDLNNALVGFILTGYAGYSTAAGFVGPKVQVDHDISLLIPEIWARLPVQQRDPRYLIDNGYLEKLEDFTHNGQRVLASRLGYRITAKFVHDVFGKVFDNPTRVFDDEILRPELQSMEQFVDGINNIVEAQQRVAKGYLLDGSIELCCPPLRALIEAMARGHDLPAGIIEDRKFRASFSGESLLKSPWYERRLRIKQDRDIALWRKHVSNLESFLGKASHADVCVKMNLQERLRHARESLERVERPDYLQSLRGTIGADPIVGGRN